MGLLTERDAASWGLCVFPRLLRAAGTTELALIRAR